jgi:hypothetical protein
MVEKSVELTGEEREYLVTLLQFVLSETRVEVRRTDHRDYREHVKHREDVIRGLLEKLEGAAIPAATGLHG